MQKPIYILTALLSYYKGKVLVLPSQYNILESSIHDSLQSLTSQVTSQTIVYEVLTVVEQPESIQLAYWGVVNHQHLLATDYRPLMLNTNTRLNAFQKLARQQLAEKVLVFSSHHLIQLLGKIVTIDDLWGLYKATVNSKIDKGNFHKQVKRISTIVDTNKRKEGLAYRPPRLYKIKERI